MREASWDFVLKELSKLYLEKRLLEDEVETLKNTIKANLPKTEPSGELQPT
jgi:hypothetical protein